MRLFPELAFYVTMIVETLKDISTFFIMFIMCIAMFANAFFALSGMQVEDSADIIEDAEPLWSEAFKRPFIDSFFN